MPAEYSKTIICLANSRKLSGRCVAGKTVLQTGFGKWVRPVSSRTEKELSAYDRHYHGQHRSEPALLDIIDIDFLARDPHPYQPENHQIDDKMYWGFQRQASYAEALSAVDAVQPDLWGLSPDTSYHGHLDRVATEQASAFGYSLRLIKVLDFRIRVNAEGSNFGNMKKKLRGYFTYSNHYYGIMITDPVVENMYLSRDEGHYDIGKSLLCVSLSEPFSGYAYKLVAGVILPPP